MPGGVGGAAPRGVPLSRSILYISDFDPGGQSMPLAVARKVEFFLRKGNHNADVMLYPIALTAEQCNSYDPPLPRSPIKDSERRRDSFEARHGEGATELDALEALYPGDFAAIVNAAEEAGQAELKKANAIAKRVRRRLADQIRDAKSDWQDTQAEIAEHRAEIEELFNEINVKLEPGATGRNPYGKAFNASLQPHISEFSNIDWPEFGEINEVENPLYDSSRGYTEQIDRYKEHQDRPTGYAGRLARKLPKFGLLRRKAAE